MLITYFEIPKKNVCIQFAVCFDSHPVFHAQSMLACIIGLFVIKRHVSSISAIFMTRTSQILVINPVHKVNIQGRIQGGRGTRRAPPPPPKIGKNMIFWRKIVIFHTKYPQNFRASLCIWKKSDFFWRKIVIFHTKYPNIFRASLRSAHFF